MNHDRLLNHHHQQKARPHYKRTVTSESLPRVINLAHAVIDSIWYDLDVNTKGQLIITNADTGGICWTENITPYEE